MALCIELMVVVDVCSVIMPNLLKPFSFPDFTC